MDRHCQHCGVELQHEYFCPRCGATTNLGARAADNSEPPGATMVHPDELPSIFRQPEAQHTVRPLAAAEPPPRPGGQSKRVLMVVVGVLVLGLGAAASFTLPLFKGSPPGASSGAGGPTGLTVIGAPASASAWRAGYRQLWRVNPADRMLALEPGSAPFGGDFAGRNADVVALSSDITTASGAALGMSATAGKTLWHTVTQEGCAGIVNGDLMHCQGGRMGSYPIELLSMANGTSQWTGTSGDLRVDLPEGQEDYYGWQSDVVDGTWLASWTKESTESGTAQHGFIARPNDARNGMAWKTEFDYRGTDGIGRIEHGILTDRSYAVNVETGELLANPAAAEGSVAVAWVAQGVLQDGDPATAGQTLQAPDGATVTRIAGGAIPITTTELPKHPLRLSGSRVEAFDPATPAGATNAPALWSTETGLSIDSTQIAGLESVVAGYHDGLIAVAQRASSTRAAVDLVLLDEATGALLWRTSIARPAPTGSFWEALPVFTKDGSLLVQTLTREGDRDTSELKTGRLTMLDVATSHVLWSRTGMLADYASRRMAFIPDAGPEWYSGAPVSPDLEAYDSIVVNNLDETWSMLTPATVTTAALPGDAPACPTGMTPISWIAYDTGGVLLCRAGTNYAVVYPTHPDWSATRLSFSAGGYQVEFSNQAVLQASLGGALLSLAQDGTVSAYPATAVWNSEAGVTAFAIPDGLPSCPIGSWPISLSSFKGGWLLVCGVAGDRPTSMVFAHNGEVTDTATVTRQTTGYCGTFDTTTVCGYPVPGVVTEQDAGGSTQQYSATSNYFAGYGQNKAGEGNGAFGLRVPDRTAADQVRYLTQLVQKSMIGRSNLNLAVDQVRGCTNLQGAVDSIGTVVTNRQTLLSALDTAPVDFVPNGDTLLAELRTSIQLSYESDVLWLQWAESERDTHCAQGVHHPLYTQIGELNKGVATAKYAFVNDWNATIAPTFSAPRFTRAQI